MHMAVPHVEQAECANCEQEEDDMRVIKRNFDGEAGTIGRALKCRHCGAKGATVVTENGLQTAGDISYENASWNQEGDDGSDE